MNTLQNAITIIVFFLVFPLLGTAIFAQQQSQILPLQESIDTYSIVIFHRKTCSACKDLLEELSSIKLQNKYKITYKDLSIPANKELYTKTLKKCNTTDFSIPAMYLDYHCYIGKNNILTKLEEHTQSNSEPKTLTEKLNPLPPIISARSKYSPSISLLVLLGPLFFFGIAIFILKKIKL